MPFKNRKYKDSVFTDLFGSDRDGKKNFLSLYNALAGMNYQLDKVHLERKVIEQSLYKTYNNDVSWEIDGKLIVLIEHQSTINGNMPLRCLEYVTRIYESLVPPRQRYAERAYKIPNPDFYVVYVGKDKLPPEQKLYLSDAFYRKDASKLELVVSVKNCSNSQDLPIRQNCDILKEYCQFIEIVERNYDKKHPQRSFKKAIQLALDEGILTDYLDRKSREVMNMLCAKYDYKTDIAVKQEEAFESGLEKGIIKGSEQKAVEAAVLLINEFNVSPELAAQKINAPLEKVLELQAQLAEEKS